MVSTDGTSAAVCNGTGSGGGGPDPHVAYQASQVDTVIIPDGDTATVLELGLPAGSWVVVAKALALGPPVIDCKLLAHSVADPPETLEIDDIEVNASPGPVAVVLTGIAATSDEVTGVGLVCNTTTGLAAMSRIRIVATHVAPGTAN